MADFNQTDLVVRVFDRCETVGMTRAELARRLGISDAQIYQWKQRGSVAQRWYVPLATELGVSLEWLLTGLDSGSPPINVEALTRAINKVRELEAVLDQQIEAPKAARLIAQIYGELLAPDGQKKT